MSRKLVALVFLCSMALFFVTSCGVPEGEQGISKNFNYKDGYGKNSTTKIIVTRTTTKGSNPTILIVKFRMVNTGKITISYGWKNKYIMDDKGRLFEPYQGLGSDRMPPTYTTVEEQYCVYKLPDSIVAGTLWWGLLNQEADGLSYKIKLY